MISEEHLYAIALRECSLIGDINFHKLIRTFGTAEEVWKRAKKEYTKTDGIGRKTVSDIGNEDYLKFAEKEIQFCEKNNIRILLRYFNELPHLLNECDDSPAILYQKGNFDDSLQKISIVGTRNMTSYGQQFIGDFLEAASSSKCISVSGLALGVDKEVHEQSIHYKIPTVAVLAHGFHMLYPSKNKKLSEKILEEGGALFTEFNSSRKPDRENFIQRNRIIAGMSPSTIVVETGFGGGSVSTAAFANDYNREVFALPGKITDPYSQGCNQLIFQNKAAAISTVKDLVDSLGFNHSKEKVAELFPYSEISIQLTENQESIYQSIKANPQVSLDDLAQMVSVPSYKILPVILELELLGKVKSFSGRQFSAI
ncbi:DNA-processing protein DprA [Chryseobacterium carnipullorum]|uniref:DNA-processing protein DprA n=1 Tax=Chryseobacterium carnipullorum TaxID=1124835 RepID=UPI000E9B4FF8|nr:DNA-processing protein DprA [Chryseobacterium carnipullorum]MDN5475296.1 DNA-processing protein DprA [Chryseobacterium sp.]MDN5481103.1 DNA-processing protein DprA [Chryseobacterium sp.]HBV15451.1 DNA-protecting protein DprA [Chryseobacterium carnipullorum]